MAEGKLQREVKKQRPFDSAEQEALLNVVRTGDRLQIHSPPAGWSCSPAWTSLSSPCTGSCSATSDRVNRSN